MPNAKTETNNDQQTDEPKKAVSTFVPKVKKQITLPILKKEDGVPIYIRITGKFFVGKKTKGTGDDAEMKPAILAPVINLETGEEMQVIANTVLKNEIEEAYPNDKYVGLCFMVEQIKVPNKRYKNYKIAEIECPTA